MNDWITNGLESLLATLKTASFSCIPLTVGKRLSLLYCTLESIKTYRCNHQCAKYLSIPISVLIVLALLSASSQKHSPFKVLNAIGLSSILAGVAVWFLNPAAWFDVAIFASGIIPAWILGIVVLAKLLKNNNFSESPFAYRAMAEPQPKLFLLLFLSFLGMVGFPISPAFLGEDLLLFHVSNHAPWVALPITVAFAINGIAAARVFERLCMGTQTELNIMIEELEIKVALSIKIPKHHTA
ncbi:hypothetical protein [Methylobacter psychrophilus]|uniref:hypothetical protein n=1 Tax=Methylobacter psychrophilus TaxID=96941 RepID=UPI0021D4DE70|nr:hypothetical protein [Methylobacter psychrophilus]